MKTLIVAAVATFALAGCIAVPAPYAGEAYYHPAPAVGVGIYAPPVYAPPVYYGHRPPGHHGHHGHRPRHRHGDD